MTMTKARPVALVTGASSGIGKAAALALAQAGFEVIGTSRNASRVADRDGVTFLDLDVASDESVTAVVQRVIERYGRLDVLVNNAGIGASGAAEETSVAQDQSFFDVNVLGIVRVTRAALPWLRASDNAVVVNTCSVAASVGLPNRALYSATKGAVQALTLAMAADHLAEGIRVCCVYPGTADTPWVRRLLARPAPPRLARLLTAAPGPGGHQEAKMRAWPPEPCS